MMYRQANKSSTTPREMAGLWIYLDNDLIIIYGAEVRADQQYV